MFKYKNLLVDTNQDLFPQFNLSLLHFYASDYRVDESGIAIKNQPILKPREWLYLDETQVLLFKIFQKEYNLTIYEDVNDNIHIDRFAVYLAYLQYCFGDNLPQIINDYRWI